MMHIGMHTGHMEYQWLHTSSAVCMYLPQRWLFLTVQEYYYQLSVN